jgi:hypothetical protein
VHGEVKRLTDAGLLGRREVGRSALVRTNPDNRLVKPLAELLLLSWGRRRSWPRNSRAWTERNRC